MTVLKDTPSMFDKAIVCYKAEMSRGLRWPLYVIRSLLAKRNLCRPTRNTTCALCRLLQCIPMTCVPVNVVTRTWLATQTVLLRPPLPL